MGRLVTSSLTGYLELCTEFYSAARVGEACVTLGAALYGLCCLASLPLAYLGSICPAPPLAKLAVALSKALLCAMVTLSWPWYLF